MSRGKGVIVIFPDLSTGASLRPAENAFLDGIRRHKISSVITTRNKAAPIPIQRLRTGKLQTTMQF